MTLEEFINSEMLDEKIIMMIFEKLLIGCVNLTNKLNVNHLALNSGNVFVWID